MQSPGLTAEELDELAFHIPHVKSWLEAAEKVLLEALNNDVPLKNVKIVPTQARRYWKLEGEPLLTLLRKFSKLDVVAPRVPLSPSQAEKTLGKKRFAEKLAEFVDRRSSGMKLSFTHDETEEDLE